MERGPELRTVEYLHPEDNQTAERPEDREGKKSGDRAYTVGGDAGMIFHRITALLIKWVSLSYFSTNESLLASTISSSPMDE